MAKKHLLLKDERVESAKDRASSMDTGIRDLASLDQVERGGKWWCPESQRCPPSTDES